MILHLSKRQTFIISLFVLAAIFLISRLLFLTRLPIFTDEAIYIRWSQIGATDANWRFISLTDGKQPLYTWIAMVLLKFIADPLFAGRLVSVLAGIGGSIGIGFLAFELFRNRRIALLASAVYILSPFALVYDRLALYDSLVAAFSIWNLFLAIRLVRSLRLDIALIFGMVLGIGMLNKTSAFFSLYLLPFTLLLFDWHAPDVKKRLLRWIILAGIAGVLSQAIYGILRLSPFFHMITQKDSVFVYPIKEWLQHPLRFYQGNIRGLFDWLRGYLTPPLFLAVFFPLLILQHKNKEKILLYLWWFLPFTALALFGKVLYPRFILFMTMPLLVLISLTIEWCIVHIKKRLALIAVLFVLFFPSLYMGYFIITNPRYAPIPFSDKGQLIDDWPSGWGVSESVSMLRTEAKKGKISIFTEGTFGLMPYAIEIYLVQNKNVYIHGIWPLPENMPPEILQSAQENPTYFILNETQKIPFGWPLQMIGEFQKGNRSDRYLRLFRVVLPIATRV